MFHDSQVLKSDAVTSGLLYYRCDWTCFWRCWCSLCGLCGLGCFCFCFLWTLFLLLEDYLMCVVIGVFLLPAAALSGRWLAGLSANLSLCLWFLRQVIGESVHQTPALVVGPPRASVNLPRLCFRYVTLSRNLVLLNRSPWVVKICTIPFLFSTERGGERVLFIIVGKMCLFMCKYSIFRIKLYDYYLLHGVHLQSWPDVLFL